MVLNNERDFQEMLSVLGDRAEELGLDEVRFKLGQIFSHIGAGDTATAAKSYLRAEYYEDLDKLVMGAYDDLLDQEDDPYQAERFIREYLDEALDNYLGNYGNQRDVVSFSDNFEHRGDYQIEPFMELVRDAYQQDVYEAEGRFLYRSDWESPIEWLAGMLGDEDEAEEEDDE